MDHPILTTIITILLLGLIVFGIYGFSTGLFEDLIKDFKEKQEEQAVKDYFDTPRFLAQNKPYNVPIRQTVQVMAPIERRFYVEVSIIEVGGNNLDVTLLHEGMQLINSEDINGRFSWSGVLDIGTLTIKMKNNNLFKTKSTTLTIKVSNPKE